MRVHVVDQKTLHRHLIARMVVGAIPELSALTFARLHDDHMKFVEQADLVITSGGTWVVHKNPYTHKRLVDSLISAGKPILGICLGAESLIHSFDGEIVELPKRQVGIKNVQINDPKLQAYLQARTLPVYAYHKWAIKKLPPGFVELASSPTGVEFFRHESLPIFGTQFHPEVRRDKNEGYHLFDWTLQEIRSPKKNIPYPISSSQSQNDA